MKKHRKKIIIGIIGLLLLIYVGVNGYLVNYAFVRDSARLGAPARLRRYLYGRIDNIVKIEK